MLLPVVKLKSPRNSRHPWIYKKMTTPPRGIDLVPGSLVEVRDKNNTFVGRGFYHPENTIALRMLTERQSEEIDARFIQNRLARAKRLREDILRIPERSDSYRLVHAESDDMPGLIIEKYADLLVIEPYIAGWMHLAEWLVEGLNNLFPGMQVAVRSDPRTEAKENISFAKWEKANRPPPFVDIVENGINYRVDFKTGHKTGFFLDQRDNRARVASMARGRTVLDLCCYTGGFALSAWKGGALSVEAVDLDEAAIAAARVNAGRNNAANIDWIHQDAYDMLRQAISAEKRYGMVVLDPPKLAAGPDDAEQALKRYYDFNRSAMDVVEPGGLFVTCSCSGAVSEERWRQIVRKAAADSGNNMTIFRAAGPGDDHPVAGDFP